MTEKRSEARPRKKITTVEKPPVEKPPVEKPPVEVRKMPGPTKATRRSIERDGFEMDGPTVLF